jgi:hypothetical protein
MNFRCRATLVYAYDNISPAQCFPWMFHQAHLGTASARVLLSSVCFVPGNSAAASWCSEASTALRVKHGRNQKGYPLVMTNSSPWKDPPIL